jgi:hypothetical protein
MYTSSARQARWATECMFTAFVPTDNEDADVGFWVVTSAQNGNLEVLVYGLLLKSGTRIYRQKMKKYINSYINIYCNKFAGSISRWKFITLTVQYTTLDYSSQLV